MIARRTTLGLVAAILACALSCLGSSAGASAAEPPSCTGRTMAFVAHEDDDLLFLSPTLQREIDSGRCVRTVFLTAGDDGKPQSYWVTREEGVEAAYAQMAAVPDAWTTTSVIAAGHTLVLRTLTADPRLSVVFMRLPDGGFPFGKGTPLYGNQSLMQLWNGEEATIEAVDKSNSYDRAGLIATLASLIAAYGPRQILTQNFDESFFNGDHPDHVATGLFTQQAARQYPGAHRITAFVGYNTETRPANVTGEFLSRKSAAFYAYGAHDEATCTSAAACAGTEYEVWLAREYVAGRETAGVVADAGFGQSVATGATVTLDGSGSSDATGAPLAYEWTQVGGPSVTLSDPTAAKPTFKMISHPTVLTFALTVRAEGQTSTPDYVQIRVPSADPTPVAIAGAEGTAAPGATVELDGSESWDPNSLPLEYEWTQTAGPEVTILGGETDAARFVAPRPGPAELTFSLVVSNGSERSAPAEVTVAVLGTAPSLIGAGSSTFTAGKAGAVDIEAEGSTPIALTLAGALPPGVSFIDHGDGTASLSGTPAADVAPPGTTREYPLVVEAVNGFGRDEEPFKLLVAVPAEEATPVEPNPPVRPGQPAAPAPTPTEATPPTLSVPSVAYAYLGRRLELPIGASGDPIPTVALLGAAPPGLTLRTTVPGAAVLAGKPRKRGTFEVAVGADSSAGDARRQVKLVVDPVPTLSSAGVKLEAGAPVRRAVNVKGPGASAVKCLGGRPPGIRCAVAGRRVILSGTPGARAVGSYPLRVELKGRAGEVTRGLTLRIARTPA